MHCARVQCAKAAGGIHLSQKVHCSTRASQPGLAAFTALNRNVSTRVRHMKRYRASAPGAIHEPIIAHTLTKNWKVQSVCFMDRSIAAMFPAVNVHANAHSTLHTNANHTHSARPTHLQRLAALYLLLPSTQHRHTGTHRNENSHTGESLHSVISRRTLAVVPVAGKHVPTRQNLQPHFPYIPCHGRLLPTCRTSKPAAPLYLPIHFQHPANCPVL